MKFRKDRSESEPPEPEPDNTIEVSVVGNRTGAQTLFCTNCGPLGISDSGQIAVETGMAHLAEHNRNPSHLIEHTKEQE